MLDYLRSQPFLPRSRASEHHHERGTHELTSVPPCADQPRADRSRRRHRPCPPEGRGHRPRTGLLRRRARVRVAAAVRVAGCVRLGGRLPPSHRPQHLGVARRLASSARHDRALPRRHPLSDAAGAGGCAAAPGRGRRPAAGSVGPRRLRGPVPRRSRRERRRAVLGPPARGVAADRGRRARNGDGAARPARSARRAGG